MLNIPALYEGQSAKITWDKLPVVNEYYLYRCFDNGFDDLDSLTLTMFNDLWRGGTLDAFNQEWSGKTLENFNQQKPSYLIFQGTATEFDDFIPIGTEFAVYRLMTRNAQGDLVVLDETMHIPVRANQPPEISGEDRHLGGRYEGFSIDYTVTDPDPNNIVSMTTYFNNNIMEEIAVVEQGRTYQLEVSTERISGLEIGTAVTLVIKAIDNQGLSSQRIYTFTVSQDHTKDAIYYLLIKDKKTDRFEPLAKMVSDQYDDFLNVGTNTYKVRVVDANDNYTDSNEVTITTAVEHGKLALAQTPDDMYQLKIKRSERPRRVLSANYPHISQQFESRRLPVLMSTGFIERTLELDFSHLSIAERRDLENIIQDDKVMIYRDHYDTKIYGKVTGYSLDPFGRVEGPNHDAVIDFTLEFKESDYKEGVAYD